MAEKFLDTVYGLETPEDTRALYDRWAASYDREIAENGYATPGRVADALWSLRPHPGLPILDYGCGTGLSGLALRRAGFERIDGMDPSPEMLDGARRRSCYRRLSQIDLDNPTPVEPGAYAAITGAGVLGTGAAPPETFDLVMDALATGGLFAFSYNDHTLADAAFTTKRDAWLQPGKARLLFREYGPHLPGLDLNAEVYVIEKA
ncbi:class I SAM-dependent DNA methyltransferase [Pukyongiella litopenaei]|uniref:Methyltransferase domain-containing protein n=1 Tax=Pukyongiella litopenaei TaxID=2605946 RepID=A0A2S0MTZ2_9RHOB|nr:methyltransferase domain-containing protein [Pukyongiella litopenaei]AVO39191.1 methyltransferase domain-containing protein [Pukyongiella litopenaei]